MRFVYEYRSSDNAHHEDVIDAPNREAVFTALKSRGIRPASVREAPGFFNKLFGKGKRWIAIVALSILVVGALCAVQTNRRTIRTIRQSQFAPMPRHQIYGDPVLMDELAKSGFGTVFANAGDRILARYAEPGVAVERLSAVSRKDAAAELERALAEEPVLSPEDLREVGELKRIVLGMREELRRYLANGVGTCETYLRRLDERQTEEVQIRARPVAELKLTNDEAVRVRRNAELRALGLRTIPKTGGEGE